MRGLRSQRKGGIPLALHISGSAVSTAMPLSSHISSSNTLIHSPPLPAGKNHSWDGKRGRCFLAVYVVSLLEEKSDIQTPPLVLPVNKEAAKMISYDLQGPGLCKEIGFERVYVAR